MASVLPGFETDNWHGLFAPAATPRAIVDRLNREVLQALKSACARPCCARDPNPLAAPLRNSRDILPTSSQNAKVVKASVATVN